jgi:hypothetical protein
MASRMDRYRVGEGRSARNQDIYKQLEELGTYTNIEGVASIEGSNEIDISKIKEMLSNRENYQKQKRYKDLLNNEEKTEQVVTPIEEEEKNYDIKDVLSDALKNRNVMENDNHKIELSKYDIIKELIDKKNKEDKKTDADLSDNLLESLIGDNNEKEMTIKQVIEEAKSEQQPEDDMDKTFFTNSISLTDSDFENLKEMHTDIKTNNKLLKIVSVILAIAVVCFLIVLILK